MVLYGAPVREETKKKLEDRIKELGRSPVLAIVQAGDREDSNIYIKKKIEFGEEIGIEVRLEKFPYSATRMPDGQEAMRGKKDLKIEMLEEKIIGKIEELNKTENIDGIIMQLPLPEGVDTEKILNNIDKRKDADGLRETREGEESKIFVTPATARAVIKILDFYKIPVVGKKSAVLGQSVLAGRPIADALAKRGAEVFRCDINTKNIPEISKRCGILVSAVGKPGLITKDFVNSEQTVIDVGINKITHPPVPPLTLREREPRKPNNKIVGDVNFDEVEPLVAAITPVPGGVGPVTVACLFENLLDLCYT